MSDNTYISTNDGNSDRRQDDTDLLSSQPPSTKHEQYELKVDMQKAQKCGFELKRIRGPKPGTTAGQKRKPDSQLSTHPHTKRQRERHKNMPPIQRAIENAKNADNMAVHRALGALKKTKEFQNANSESQEQMRAKTKESTLRVR
jgi:hypothetical protein